jgi:hypothetical protein
MTEGAEKISPLFLQLVLSLQSAAMYQMGKIVSPVSGKIEKDMEQARISIDLLTMLQEKTKGNLLEDEKRIIDSTVYNLQMNYVDELNRENSESEPKDKSPAEEKPSAEASETPAEENGNKE